MSMNTENKQHRWKPKFCWSNDHLEIGLNLAWYEALQIQSHVRWLKQQLDEVMNRQSIVITTTIWKIVISIVASINVTFISYNGKHNGNTAVIVDWLRFNLLFFWVCWLRSSCLLFLHLTWILRCFSWILLSFWNLRFCSSLLCTLKSL